MFYVYTFRANGVPCYVGKGVGDRFLLHLGRPDFPRAEELSVTFASHFEEIDALKHECELIQRYGIKSQGGLLLNKFVPNLTAILRRSGKRQGSFRDMLRETEVQFAAFAYGFIVRSRLRKFSRIPQIAVATGYSTGTVKRAIDSNPDIERIGSPGRPSYLTIEVLMTMFTYLNTPRRTRL